MNDPHNAYGMQHWSIVAPKVDNGGRPSGYPSALRAGLRKAMIDGWTEHDSVGVWRGRSEPGVTFTLYRMPTITSHGWRSLLMSVARTAMPDQEAVQVTYHGEVTVYEA